VSDLLLHYMPRVRRDINECADFVGRQPRGKPQDRKADIDRAIEAICAHPELRPRELYRPESGLLRAPAYDGQDSGVMADTFPEA
jgi:hypothetical protein